jgi:hypothetical protein
MKLFKKIDLYYQGDYLHSTAQAKTCKKAIENYLGFLVDLKSRGLAGQLDSWTLGF